MRFLLLLFLICFHAKAATYYVDMVDGDDAAAGTSESTPWKHCPGQSTSPARTINSGDVILFKRGVVHPLDAGIQYIAGVTYGEYGSGAKPALDGGNTITYAFSDGATKRSNASFQNLVIQNFGGWGDADPLLAGVLVSNIDIVTDTITTAAPHGFSVGTQIHFTMDGRAASTNGVYSTSSLRYIHSVPTASSFTVSASSGGALLDLTAVGAGEFRAHRPVSNPPGGTGIGLSGGSDNILVENCEFYRIGQWRNTAPASGTNSVTGTGVSMENNNGVTIRGCIFEKMRTPISVKATASGGPIENILVENSTIKHMVWGVDMAPRSTGAVLQNVTFRNCQFSGAAVYDKGNWLGFGEKPHTDNMFLRTAGMASTWTNILIERCKFYEDTPGASEGGTANIYISQGPSVRIQNCLLLESPFANPAINIGYAKPSGMTQTVEILNNTFLTSAKCIGAGASATGANPDVVRIKNNIIWRTNTGVGKNVNALVTDPALYASTGRTLEVDNNVYWTSYSDPATANIFNTNNGSGYKTFAQWRAAYPTMDANSIVANPLIASMAGARSTWLPHVLDGSPAIGAGQNLSSLFTNDYAGTLRAAVSPWTIGAYSAAYVPPVDVVAPTFVSATLGADGQSGVLVFSEPMQGINLSHYLVSGHTLGALVGSGTTWNFTLSPKRQAGPNFDLVYTAGAGRSADLAGNLLASGTFTIVNNSLEATSESPRAQRRGPAAPKRKPIGL